MTAKRARTARTMSASTALFVHERRRAVDLRHLDPRPRLDYLVVEVGARRPLLSADADTSTGVVDAHEHHGPGALECLRPRPDRRGHVQVPLRERPEQDEGGERTGGE